jgi:hypothetical protein
MSDLTRPPGGQVVTHHVRVRPPRRMRAISGEVEVLLNGFGEGARRSGALLASELVAQVVGRASGPQSGRVGLTVQLREDAVRLEATGPSTPSIGAAAGPGVVPTDPLADWGLFILDRLSDRWGMGGGARRNIWAEIR